MLNLLAQAAGPLSVPKEQAKLYAAILIVIGFAVTFALTKIPARARRPIVVLFTLVAGAFYAINWGFPAPIAYDNTQVPRNMQEYIGGKIIDGNEVMTTIQQTITNILLFLGVYSVLRIHGGRVSKQGKDWVFSLVLLISMMTMVIFGYWDYNMKIADPGLTDPAKWTFVQSYKDLLFDGMLQNMDAAMFSIIAFFILSAAYRAFRIRSIESTLLLASALIMMLSLMAGVETISTQILGNITHNDPGNFLNNFSLTSIANWIKDVVRSPGIRALEWGILLGGLSMGLRLWLSLEKGGTSAS